MVITLNTDVINALDLSSCKPRATYFSNPCGQEHYRLLCYLSTLFEDTLFIDIGTNEGDSALALGFGHNYVVSFDLTKYSYSPIPNCHYVIGDFRQYLNKVVNARIILYDIPHDDDSFPKLCHFLEKSKWNGFLILDDCQFDPKKRADWDAVTLPKIDATKYGHFSGTGIVNFSSDIEFRLE